MIQAEILEKTKILVGAKFEVDISTLNRDTTFKEDLGSDSLDDAELIMEIEDVFGLIFPDQIYTRLTSKTYTIGQLVDFISILDKARERKNEK
jgi:acyl carrier protein